MEFQHTQKKIPWENGGQLSGPRSPDSSGSGVSTNWTFETGIPHGKTCFAAVSLVKDWWCWCACWISLILFHSSGLATHQFINYLVPSRVGSAFYLWRHSLQSREEFVMMVRTKEYQRLICSGSQPLSGNLFSKNHHNDVRGHLRVLSFNSIKLDYGFRGWLPWQYWKALHKGFGDLSIEGLRPFWEY